MDSEQEHLNNLEDFGDTSSSSAEEWNEEEANGSFDMSIVGEEVRNGRLRCADIFYRSSTESHFDFNAIPLDTR